MKQYENRILLVLTLVIGAVVGLVVVAFILLSENLGAKLYPAGGAAWRRVLIPIVGSLGSGFLLFRYFPGARGSGIPQTKTALFLRDGYISLRTVLGKFGLCSISLASGIALGREGPSVQVGAGIASVMGRRLGLSTASVKALVPVGASAALAAAFNTPIAAVLFSLEEVMGDMHAPVLGSIVLSSATSWIVLHLVLGDEPLFHVPSYQLVHPIEFVFYAVLGLAGGVVSVAFVKLLLWQRKKFMSLPKATQWVQPAVGGLTVGILGWFFPDVLGVGYGIVSQALNGQILVGAMALLVGLKIIATATCYSSGNAGGIFGPSLFIGAMMGGAIGGVAHMLMPDYTGSVGAYALVGMGTAFAGVVRVPLTSVIMIFEITRDYSIIVPLMIANLISYYISSKLQKEPIYEALQHQDGIHLPTPSRDRESILTVASALRESGSGLPATQTVAQAVASVQKERGAWPVVDEHGLRGMVTVEQLNRAIDTGHSSMALDQLVPDPGLVEHLTGERYPHLHADHPLDVAMRRLATSGLPAIPVVSRTNIRELQGSVGLPEILSAYGLAEDEVKTEAAVSAPIGKLPAKLMAQAIAALIVVMLLAGFLNYFYRAERATRADRYFQAGNQLFLDDRIEEATSQYRDALSISHKQEHRLALGLALVKGGRLNEAAIYLSEVLRSSPSSGPANLGMARVEEQQGRIDAAIPFYQRAIYGSWPEKAEENRFQSRVELVNALLKAGRTTAAQAELLSMAAVAAMPVESRKQVGRLLMDNGLARNAVDVYRDLASKERYDSTVFRGFGDAEFAVGDFVEARTAYRQALTLAPSVDELRRKAELAERAIEIDPTVNGLRAAERYARSRALLAAVLERVANCVSDVQESRAMVESTKRPASYSDAADRGVELARHLWSAAGTVCGGQMAWDDVLPVVMGKLQRR